MPLDNSFPFSLDKRDVEGSRQVEGGPEQPLPAVLLSQLLQEAEPAAGRAAAAGQAAAGPAGGEWVCSVAGVAWRAPLVGQAGVNGVPA